MIIIPAYNESKRLQNKKEEWGNILKKYQCILVDDGSIDDTAEIAKSMGFKVIQLPKNKGKGEAIRRGMLEALKYNPEYLLFADADLSCPESEWVKLINEVVLNGIDVAIGSRYIKGAKAKRTLIRKIISKSFNIYTKIILKMDYQDTQCGCKAFNRQSAMYIFGKPLTFEKFAVDLEILTRAEILGLKVKEVPITWNEESGTKIKIVKTSIELGKAVWELKKIREIENTETLISGHFF